MEEAMKVQYAANDIIYKMCSGHGNMYGMIKEMLRINESLDLGGVREPLPQLIDFRPCHCTGSSPHGEGSGCSILLRPGVFLTDVRRSVHSYLCSTAGNVNGPRSFLEGERAGMGDGMGLGKGGCFPGFFV